MNYSSDFRGMFREKKSNEFVPKMVLTRIWKHWDASKT